MGLRKFNKENDTEKEIKKYMDKNKETN